MTAEHHLVLLRSLSVKTRLDGMYMSPLENIILLIEPEGKLVAVQPTVQVK